MILISSLLFKVDSARLMSGRCCHTQQPHCGESSNNAHFTNRNSTGSTNSSQTSSGFESSKVCLLNLIYFHL